MRNSSRYEDEKLSPPLARLYVSMGEKVID